MPASTSHAAARSPRLEQKRNGAARGRNLTADLVDSLGDRIRDGRLARGSKLPTEAEIMAAYGVSRTVVREALSKLQAAGQVRTRHGIGTFVVGPGDTAPFRITPEQLATLADVVAMLELRIGVETEAAALAAQRRTDANLREMRAALDDFHAALAAGRDAVAADLRFHLAIARATQNAHFAGLMTTMGASLIPRARLDPPFATPDPKAVRPRPAARAGSGRAPEPDRPGDRQRSYLERVNGEHENIFDAIAAGDAEAARAAMRLHLAASRERRRRAQLAATAHARSVGRDGRRRRAAA